VSEDTKTQPDGSDDTDAQDTEGHKFNIGLGPNSPDETGEDTQDTEGHKFNIGLGPNTPDDDTKGEGLAS
jgi:hypothetical protein